MKLYGSSEPSPQYKSPPPIAGTGTRINWLPIDWPEGVTQYGMSLEMRHYLIFDRDIDSTEYQHLFSLTDWPTEKRLIIPYIDDKGDLIYLAVHSYVGDTPKYMYPKGPKPLYVPNRDMWRNHVVIVEGQFDGMRVYEAGYYAIAIGGSYLSSNVEMDLLDEIGGRDCTVCLDGDALAQASKLVTRLLELGVYAKIAILRPGEDPASVGVERLKELIG